MRGTILENTGLGACILSLGSSQLSFFNDTNYIFYIDLKHLLYFFSGKETLEVNLASPPSEVQVAQKETLKIFLFDFMLFFSYTKRTFHIHKRLRAAQWSLKNGSPLGSGFLFATEKKKKISEPFLFSHNEAYSLR